MTSDIWRQSEFEAELLHDAALTCRVIQAFVNDLPSVLEAIHVAFAARHGDDLAKTIHYLHGSAAQLQLTALAQQCRALHQQVLADTLDTFQLQNLVDAVAQAQQCLSAYLATMIQRV